MLTGGLLLVFIGAGLICSLWLLSSARGLPDLTLHTIDGREVNPQSQKGAPLLVTFWATSCQSCLVEMPHLIELYHELRPAGLEMLAISMAYDPPSRVVALAERNNIPYPVALDIDGRAARAFGDIRLTPASLLFGPDGALIRRHTGRLDMPRLKREIKSLLDHGQAGAASRAGRRADALV